MARLANAGRIRGALALLPVAVATMLACSPPAVARPAGRVTARRASTGVPLPEGTVCHELRSRFGKLVLGAGRSHLKVLVTGDSMIYPLSEELGVARPAGMRVVSDRHDGTGLTVPRVNWPALARRQVARFHPDATVISLGGRDGGIPLRDTSGRLVECCGTRWLSLYAGLLRPLALAYERAGRGRVYWLTIPAPSEQARAPLYEAVNEAVRLLATEIGPAMHVVPVDAVVSPGGFQSTIAFEGLLPIAPRAPDGIHLDHAGACIERSLVTEAMLEEGLISSSVIPWGHGVVR